uniref:Uncharacterized protein n=1 Tax=Moniliophthora roreri TaxID=221103 RepID=A0A0W0FLT7_MONRR
MASNQTPTNSSTSSTPVIEVTEEAEERDKNISPPLEENEGLLKGKSQLLTPEDKPMARLMEHVSALCASWSTIFPETV